MKGFDVKSLDQKRINTLRKKYINQKEFVSEEVEKKKSVAANSMCELVLALDKYAYVCCFKASKV